VIRSKGFPPELSAIFLYPRDADLKAHPAYRQAKAGDKSAALELVVELAATWLYSQRGSFKPGLLFVAPHALEATGDNAIPQTLATVCAALYRGEVDTEIVQTDKVYHTGADPMERMAARAQFEGHVSLLQNSKSQKARLNYSPTPERFFDATATTSAVFLS
jgi:hypothetical protein